MSASDSRNEFFDVCKGIGILCVYYGHSAMWRTLPSRMVFSFHMPLFFLLSGIFFDGEKISGFGCLARKIWRNLLLPYCFFLVLGSIIKLDITISNWSASPIHECCRIIHGEGSNAIWFLVCLAVVQTSFWLLWKMARRIACARIWWAALICSVCVGAHMIYRSVPQDVVDRLPFMLASVPSGMFFFAIGFLAKTALLKFSMATTRISYLMISQLVIFAFFVFANFIYKNTFDIRAAKFSIRVLPSCFLGVSLVFLSAKMIVTSNMAKMLFAGIGKRSLCLFALELPLSYFVSKMTRGGFVAYPMWQTPHVLVLEPVRIVLIMVMAWICSYPVMLLLGRMRT